MVPSVEGATAQITVKGLGHLIAGFVIVVFKALGAFPKVVSTTVDKVLFHLLVVLFVYQLRILRSRSSIPATIDTQTTRPGIDSGSTVKTSLHPDELWTSGSTQLLNNLALVRLNLGKLKEGIAVLDRTNIGP
ncbi:hypothetical protein C8Q76DRAFT_688374 [Earliella scabrosa]|nr:hypothetical protein C8Q76DRAFT_688368 [Earliella scabrosa]KAI0745202.1 hypothetical protein C8Q76DRAFT_688372 [Earliella scabrosa]KAI0745205.1 hypothetical protein C8Q76DRAFT_688374 [Earliella scabrosa]